MKNGRIINVKTRLRNVISDETMKLTGCEH
jgi:hypothetical protein